MRSLQDYREIYREIANNLKITGDSVELLVQLLANASYLSEVENVSYVQEASLERCTLINSKIQHCMNIMYSVFRGRCPRVMMKFKPTKYHNFNLYDPIVNSNDFTIYYLGYLVDPNSSIIDPSISDNYDPEEDGELEPNVTGTRSLPIEEGFRYSSCVIPPAEVDEISGEERTVTIIGLMAKEKIDKQWSTSRNNTYYVEALDENLSNDMYVHVNDESDEGFFDTTRVFSDHILNPYIFDLTTTSYSSRLYIADIFRRQDEVSRNDEPNSSTNDDETTNLNIWATYYKFSRISDYKPAELKKININGGEMKAFDPEFLEKRGYKESAEVAPGVLILPEIGREGIDTIHYKANKDRYVSSIIRSNSDVGTVLEEMYPAKIMSGGTNFEFTTGEGGSVVNIYYVPNDILNLLTDTEIEDFVDTKKAYYIVDTINVEAGSRYTAFFNIDVELFKPVDISNDIAGIFENYEKRFNIDINASLEEIKTLISKIPNIKQVINLDVMFLDPVNEPVYDDSELYNNASDPDLKEIKPNIYFKIDYNVNSIIQTRS